MIRPIVKLPNQLLLQKSEPVPILINQEFLKLLVQDMVDTATAHNAAGLAAVQVGAALRVIVVTKPGKNGRDYVCLLNPAVTWKSGVFRSDEEGCLSIPGKTFRVARPLAIEVTYQMFPSGTVSVQRVSGMLARILQHEIDHLDGILIDQKQTEAVTLQ